MDFVVLLIISDIFSAPKSVKINPREILLFMFPYVIKLACMNTLTPFPQWGDWAKQQCTIVTIDLRRETSWLSLIATSNQRPLNSSPNRQNPTQRPQYQIVSKWSLQKLSNLSTKKSWGTHTRSACAVIRTSYRRTVRHQMVCRRNGPTLEIDHTALNCPKLP